ncbi:formyltetrahydrofolate deformylase [Sphingobacteriales bacterium UPWRP_1]|nr:formyltetrahydrofolate deformylase [Sphingobacteriales bacterium TSM_CSS]PSJ77296.1 formyltetrahydrofolate deformylase [Sphingobacteriales bacterium UPWRP_1]
MDSTHILLIDCPDEKGLVFRITQSLYQQQLNILKNDEYVDRDTNHFFMRTEFEGNLNPDNLTAHLTQQLPKGVNIRLNPKKKKDIVLLVTKEHHCLGDLLIRYAYDELNANILAVMSNHNMLQSLVAKFGVPFHYISHEHKTREEHEQTVLKALQIYNPEYLVLAKYMRILTPQFVQHYPNRIINIHHSFLPAFIGANPYRQAYERGVKIIGATAHFVNNNLDEGPIIDQNVIRVDHRFSADAMAKAGREVEKDVLAQALKWVFQDRVFIHGNKTVIF